LEAQRFLAKRPDLSPEELTRLIELVRVHPRCGPSEKLLILGLQLRIDPESAPQILAEANQQYQGGTPSDLKLFASWLNSMRRFETTLQAVPAAAALEEQDLFIIHLDALAGLGRWTDARRLLQTRAHPLPEAIACAFRARCELKLNNPDGAELQWKRLLDIVNADHEHLPFVAQYAEKAGDAVHAEKLYRVLAKTSDNPRLAYQGLIRLAEASHDTPRVCALLGEMTQRWPADRTLRHEHAYLSLLLGRNVSATQKAAEALVAETPDHLPYRLALALAHYRQNQFSEALKVCTTQQYNWQIASPSHRAIFGAILAANGRLSEAHEVTRSVMMNQLRKEERELLPGSG
jgi:hypothetical protein